MRSAAVEHLDRATACQVRPDEDPLDGDLDRNAEGVNAPPTLPERMLIGPKLEALPDIQDGRWVVLHRRAEGRGALNEDVLRAIGRGVLARVKRQRDPWVAPDPLELPPGPDGRVYGCNHSRLTVEHGTLLTGRRTTVGRRRVGEHQRVVAIQDLLDLV